MLKKIVEAIRELVSDANLDCSENGIQMQAMDSSHVSLCALTLSPEGFDHYRCDQSLAMGIHMPNLAKILKCAGNDDSITLKHNDFDRIFWGIGAPFFRSFRNTLVGSTPSSTTFL